MLPKPGDWSMGGKDARVISGKNTTFINLYFGEQNRHTEFVE
jgi:hypothetical protein